MYDFRKAGSLLRDALSRSASSAPVEKKVSGWGDSGGGGGVVESGNRTGDRFHWKHGGKFAPNPGGKLGPNTNEHTAGEFDEKPGGDRPVAAQPKGKATEPASQQVTHSVTPGKQYVQRGEKYATPEEYAKVREWAKGKIAAAPITTRKDQIYALEYAAKHNRAMKQWNADTKAWEDGGKKGPQPEKPKTRAGGDKRGSYPDRQKRQYKMFVEAGGLEKGYVVDWESGLKLHYTADEALNPHGYDVFEQGKIFVFRQGGTYKLPNLLPESKATNRSRNDATVRRERTDLMDHFDKLLKDYESEDFETAIDKAIADIKADPEWND